MEGLTPSDLRVVKIDRGYCRRPRLSVLRPSGVVPTRSVNSTPTQNQNQSFTKFLAVADGGDYVAAFPEFVLGFEYNHGRAGLDSHIGRRVSPVDDGTHEIFKFRRSS